MPMSKCEISPTDAKEQNEKLHHEESTNQLYTAYTIDTTRVATAAGTVTVTCGTTERSLDADIEEGAVALLAAMS